MGNTLPKPEILLQQPFLEYWTQETPKSKGLPGTLQQTHTPFRGWVVGVGPGLGAVPAAVDQIVQETGNGEVKTTHGETAQKLCIYRGLTDRPRDGIMGVERVKRARDRTPTCRCPQPKSTANSRASSGTPGGR